MEIKINVNDSVTESKFDNLHGKAFIAGYGNVGKGYVSYMRACGCVVYVTKTESCCALQVTVEVFTPLPIDDVVSWADMCMTTTGNKGVIIIII